ncbi:MAG TPA: hypothetical protein VGB77_11090 [Abditibacteriaceae bacterium]|jgi:hypothetical protein
MNFFRLIGLLCCLTFDACAQPLQPLPRKKIIEFGWHSPSPSYLRDNIREIEKRPFDGVAIFPPEEVGGGFVFDVEKWSKTTAKARESQLQLLKAIPKSETLTHNFLVVRATSTMNWHSDADWQKVEENLRFCAQAAKAGHCKGILWDAEPYGKINPWRLSEQPPLNGEKPSLENYGPLVRKRGAQFMRALQESMPGLTILSLRELSDFHKGSPFTHPLFPMRDAAQAQKELAAAWYSLRPAFINGMLDAIAPNVTLIDGNEDAYFYTSRLEYYGAYQALRHEAAALIAPENRQKYAAQFKIGHAVSLDYCAGRWADALGPFPRYLTKQALELTPEERARWFEHNVYYALTTADEYVWCYSEEMDWWKGQNIPPGFEEAIRLARRKQQNGEPLGFAVETMLETAQNKIKAQTSKP